MSAIPLPGYILRETVARALAEDLGDGDLSLAAVPAERDVTATLLAREEGILCGRPFAEEVLGQLGDVRGRWKTPEGGGLVPDRAVATFEGPAGNLLSAERTLLNFLQTLSGTATATGAMAAAVAGTGARILDTRKTLPGLRAAQKYAVRVGGGHNHRHGLYDGVLLKENHLAWAGGIEAAVAAARERTPHTLRIQVEVEDLDQYRRALEAGVDAVLLDNFGLDALRTAVAERPPGTFLEASGDIGPANAREIAETGVDAISVGALTRDLASVDLSMRFGDGGA